MGALPAIAAIDSVASLLTLVLAAVASLRAGSRLQRRMMMASSSSDGRGSLGLMDGPPILGPPDFRRRRRRRWEEEVEGGANNETLLLADGSGDGGRGNGTGCREEEEGDDDGVGEASPLWEHTEAFRRAVILGLIFDDDDDDDAHSDCRMFSDVVRSEGGSSIDDVVVRGGTGVEDEEEDLAAIAAAVEAGLLLPSTGNGGDRSAAARGGGSRNGSESSSSSGGGTEGKKDNNNPVAAMASWFVRELSAPLAAIPAWHGILRSYLRQQKNKDDESRRKPPWWCLMTYRERLRFLLTGNAGGGEGVGYDPSGLDFGSSISGTARIPRCSDDDAGAVSNVVRVRAFAPRTFRDLRNWCFRMSEGDYARSVLNAMGSSVSGSEGGAIFASDGGVDGAWGAPSAMEMMDDDAARKLSLDDDRSSMSHIFREILAGEEGHRRGGIDGAIQHRRNDGETPRTTTTTLLPYVSFQSNSKGAARAGTFFFFTADGAYMIKTVKREEAKAFLDMLPEYHRFMSEGVNGRNSLLTRIFGMYSVRFLGDGEADDDVGKRPSADVVAGGDRWDGGLFSSSGGSRGGDDASSSDLLLEDDERVYLVMHSVFPSDASSFVTERFDLKGSTVGRECSMEERRSRGANAVLKDLDLKREVEAELECMKKSDDASPSGRSRGYGLCVGRQRRTALLAQLERDVDLLRRCNVLDYSLLVGVADMETPRDKNSPGGGGGSGHGRAAPTSLQNFFRWMDFPFPYYGAGTTGVDGGTLSRMPGTRRGRHVVYYMGVIDFLQPWTVKKRLERDLKGLAGYDKTAISCVAPADYAARFLEFVESHVT